jgi:hypothetical protein
MKTVKEVRNAFWNARPEHATERRSRKRQNDYSVSIRCSFVDYVDYLSRNGEISEKLAQRVTL